DGSLRAPHGHVHRHTWKPLSILTGAGVRGNRKTGATKESISRGKAKRNPVRDVSKVLLTTRIRRRCRRCFSLRLWRERDSWPPSSRATLTEIHASDSLCTFGVRSQALLEQPVTRKEIRQVGRHLEGRLCIPSSP